MSAITLLNLFFFDTALLLTASAFWQRPIRRYTIAFVTILLTGILGDSIRNYLLPIYAALLIVCFLQKNYTLDTVVVALTAVSIIWGITMMTGCLILLISPAFLDTIAFNILNGILLVSFGFGFRHVSVKCRVVFLPEYWQGKAFLIALEMLILLFFAFILPQFALNNMRHYAIAQLTLMTLLIVVCLILNAYNKSQEKNRRLTQERRQADIIEQEYHSIISLKHYYTKLFESIQGYIRRSDLRGLEAYFERYITPIHRRQIRLQNAGNIKNILIANLLELAANYAASHPIKFEYDISGIIAIPNEIEMDVFHILAEWLNNALEALDTQTNGRLSLHMIGAMDQCQFIIENSFELNEMSPTKPGRGRGLQDVYRIIESNPHFQRYTERRDCIFTQCLIVQF